MSDVLIDQDTMEDIGDSIRSKLGVQTTYLPSEMPSAIMSISGGGGSGSAKYSETVLWSGTQSSAGSITLNESIESYQMIIFIYTAQSGDAMEGSSVRLVSDVVYGRSYHFTFSEYVVSDLNYYFSGHFDDAITFTIDELGNTGRAAVTLRKIIGIKWETMQTALIYSEEEREVGVWTDGKPLYQKSYLNISVSKNTWGNSIVVPTDIQIVKIFGYYDTFNSGNYVASFDANSGWEGSSSHFLSYFNNNGHNISFHWNYGGATTAKATITILYIKTTDTPGSGIWTTTGEYAHHYSTDEKVVGTWIDGKSIYECTWTGLNQSVTANYWNVITGISIANLGLVIDAHAYRTSSQGLTGLGLRAFQNSGNSSNNPQIVPLESQTLDTLILQYTKTT